MISPFTALCRIHLERSYSLEKENMDKAPFTNDFFGMSPLTNARVRQTSVARMDIQTHTRIGTHCCSKEIQLGICERGCRVILILNEKP